MAKDATSPITERTGVSIRLVVMLLVGCIAATGSYSALWWKLNSLENRIDTQIKATSELADASKSDRKEHAEIITTFEVIRSEIKQAMLDRWTKIDDMAYMMTYSRINNLSMSPHTRIAAADTSP